MNRTLLFALGLALAFLALGGLRVSAAPALPPVYSPFLQEGIPEASPPAACTGMDASPVAWVTDAEDESIDQQVTVYPSGITYLHAVFQYQCIPPATSLFTQFQYNGRQIFGQTFKLRASEYPGFFDRKVAYYNQDGTTNPMEDGEYSVAFLRGQELVTSGKISVGGEEPGSNTADTIQVQGTVRDQRTRNALAFASLWVLKPGVAPQDWDRNGKPNADVFTTTDADTNGQFVFPKRLARNTTYAVYVVLRGYKPFGQNLPVFSDKEADPASIDISLTKQ